VSDDSTTVTEASEVQALRARVAALEAELAEQSRATAEIVARSQEKLYWLERWNVDLDRVMARPGAIRALDSLKVVRSGIRWVRITSRRLRSPR
jgi:uncharacterized coiled-coil protein SlyX